MRKKLLVFADPGIDDSLAIIYALMNPNLEIVGIVTSYGNVSKVRQRPMPTFTSTCETNAHPHYSRCIKACSAG